jgi:DNA-directed RNA polymerase subunit H (RpoH/RPB5)
MSVRNVITQIYKSRLNILNILEDVYKYDVQDYSGFSINEIDAMVNNDQLDMLLSTRKKEEDEAATISIHKTYIKYFINGTFNVNSINNIVDDLFAMSDTLKKEDCLCIIYDGEPNDTILSHLTYLYESNNIFVVVHNLKRLQFNILEHSLVPKVSIMNETDVEQMKKQYVIENLKQLPELSRYDPQALAICIRPGQVCKFLRNSPTSLETPYYRLCI